MEDIDAAGACFTPSKVAREVSDLELDRGDLLFVCAATLKHLSNEIGTLERPDGGANSVSMLYETENAVRSNEAGST